MVIMCPHCGGLNRVAQEKLNHQPNCGHCKKPLFNGKPIEMDSAQFNRALSKSDQLLVVDFWAPWCGPCKMFAPTFAQAAAQLEPHARFIKINTEQQPDIAAQFNIRSIPTLAVFKQGRELDRISGAMDLTQFKHWLSAYI
ncbi:MAG: thioredoxin TrxC [Thiomicrospira sp.]